MLDKSSGGNAPFRFQVRSEEKTLLLEAESRDIQRRWMESCQELADAIRANKFSHSSMSNSVVTMNSRDRPSLDSQHQRKTPPTSGTTTSSSSNNSNVIQYETFTARGSTSRHADGAEKPQKKALPPFRERPQRESPTSPGGRLTRSNNQVDHVASRSVGDHDDELLESMSWPDEDDDDSDSDDDTSTEFLSGRGANGGGNKGAGFSSSFDTADLAASRRVGGGPELGTRRHSRSQLTASNRSDVRETPYDLSIEVMLGANSKLTRSSDQSNDKVGCFVMVTGRTRRSKKTIEIGMSDAIKLSTIAAAASAAAATPSSASTSQRGASGNGASSSSLARVPFSVVLGCDLEQFEQLQFQLHKTLLNQAPGNIQSTIGIGYCNVDDDFLLHSLARVVQITDKSSRESLSSSSSPAPTKQISSPVDSRKQQMNGTAKTNSYGDNSAARIIVQAYRSVPPQTVLPTTGIDMANSKFLIPTTLPSSGSRDSISSQKGLHATDYTRSSDARTFLDNDSFLNSNGDIVGGGVRFIAVDEILRVPRSTFALPLAFLDYLEEEALEKTRQLHKKTRSTTIGEGTLKDFELTYYRAKIEEYMKQRQFLMKQEKRLLDEQQVRRIFSALMSGNNKSIKAPGKDKDGVAASDEIIAPFKRSTYKSLNLWQFLPTNMQDQFLCTLAPSHTANDGDSLPFVWHTMTMGCPAAHTKGFANGGYPLNGAVTSVTSVPMATSRNLTASPDEEPLLGDHAMTSPIAGNHRHQQPQQQQRVSTDSGSSSVTAVKAELELKDRLDIIGSQILSAAVACLLSTLDLAILGSEYHRLQLENAPAFGYLINFESLLSTQGKEIGMLEDFAAGAKWLRRVFIQFRKHTTSGSFFSIKKYVPPDNMLHSSDKAAASSDGLGASTGYLMVTMGLSEAHMAVVPAVLRTGKPFRMRCVLFTQGVNEKQSLVHAYKSNSVKVQERINRDNLVELKQIYSLFRRLRTEEMEAERLAIRIGNANGGVIGKPLAARSRASNLDALDDLLVQIEYHICSPKSQYRKNVALLMDSSDFCRELGGARVTCCKSGKDRTAMSVTLEQARICCAELRATQGTRICANMRLFGVRRKNVFLNTKAYKFAFNEMQRKMLPDCYKPPAGTYKSGKT